MGTKPSREARRPLPVDDARSHARYSFDSSKFDGKKAEPQGTLNTSKEWVRAFVKGDASGLRELSSSFKVGDKGVACTHTGLIYYLHACWANEKGVVMRPDMLWYTVVSEQARMVLEYPQLYAHLFSEAKEKGTLVIIAKDEKNISTERLAATVRGVMKEPAFGALILDQAFESAPPLAQHAIASAFCYMATPYYNYCDSLCGIRSVDIVGTLEEWQSLHTAVVRVQDFGPRLPVPTPQAQGMSDDMHIQGQLACHIEARAAWLHVCADTVQRIIDHRWPAHTDMKASTRFFGDIFHYGANKQCDSGHDEFVVSGWARSFYAEHGEDLYTFAGHVSQVPYQSIDTRRMFTQAITLAYSEEKEVNVWEPQYGFVTYEVTDEELFSRLRVDRPSTA